jgi:dipeptide/tripeptide permease
MSAWLLQIILSGIIALLAVLSESSSETKKDKFGYGLKIFAISFLTLYVGNMFLGGAGEVKHEIDTGEPPF